MDLSWNEAFARATMLYQALDKMDSKKSSFLAKVQEAVNLFTIVIQRRPMYFSTNEDLEGISTSSFKYLHAAVYVSDLLQKIEDETRMQAILAAMDSLRSFFDLCLQLGDEIITKQHYDTVLGKKKMNPFQDREYKVNLIRSQKEIRNSIASLTHSSKQMSVCRGGADDEDDEDDNENSRKIEILKLRLAVLRASDDYQMMVREIPMLEMFQKEQQMIKERGLTTDQYQREKLEEARRETANRPAPTMITLDKDKINQLHMMSAHAQQTKSGSNTGSSGVSPFGKLGTPLDSIQLLERAKTFQPTVEFPKFDATHGGPTHADDYVDTKMLDLSLVHDRDANIDMMMRQKQDPAPVKYGGKLSNWDDKPETYDHESEPDSDAEEVERQEQIHWDEWTDSAAKGDRTIGRDLPKESDR